MGNSTETILYDCGSKYTGQIVDNIPHGNGTLFIHKKSPALDSKLLLNKEDVSIVQAHFQNGTLKRCLINLKNGLKYEGTLNEKSLFDGQQGKLVDQENIQYEGTFQNGKIIRGRIQSSKTSGENQVAYVCQTQGEFIGTSIINGPSTFYNITEQYLASGNFHKGKLSKGFYIFSNGDQYQGQFSQGLPNGNGIYKSGAFTNQNASSSQTNPIVDNRLAQEFAKKNQPKNTSSRSFTLKGNFQAGNPNGKGELTFSNGVHYKGRFKDGRIHGNGEYTFPDGTFYKGSFYCGSMNGDCTIQFNQKSEINKNKKKHEILEKYEGQVNNGVFHGLGILSYANGVIFKGYFLDGAKNGPGVLIYCQNKYKCLYIMNKLVGQLKLITDQ